MRDDEKRNISKAPSVTCKANKPWLTTESALCPYISDAFPYVSPETLEFAYGDAYCQYI